MSLNIKMSLTSSSEYKQGRGKYRGKTSLFRIRIKSALFNYVSLVTLPYS